MKCTDKVPHVEVVTSSTIVPPVMPAFHEIVRASFVIIHTETLRGDHCHPIGPQIGQDDFNFPFRVWLQFPPGITIVVVYYLHIDNRSYKTKRAAK